MHKVLGCLWSQHAMSFTLLRLNCSKRAGRSSSDRMIQQGSRGLPPTSPALRVTYRQIAVASRPWPKGFCACAEESSSRATTKVATYRSLEEGEWHLKQLNK